MLATCRLNGWDLATYRDPDHPLQRLMADTLADLAGEPVAATAVDGCGAPVMAISLAGLARAFGRLAAGAPGTPEAEVAAAIRAHPEFLGGTRRDVTALIRGTEGLIAKDGAEAVLRRRAGRRARRRPEDRRRRASGPARSSWPRCCAGSAWSPPASPRLEDAPVLGHGEPVGAVVAVGIEE